MDAATPQLTPPSHSCATASGLLFNLWPEASTQTRSSVYRLPLESSSSPKSLLIVPRRNQAQRLDPAGLRRASSCRCAAARTSRSVRPVSRLHAPSPHNRPSPSLASLQLTSLLDSSLRGRRETVSGTTSCPGMHFPDHCRPVSPA